jgi:hypothetical protein
MEESTRIIALEEATRDDHFDESSASASWRRTFVTRIHAENNTNISHNG